MQRVWLAAVLAGAFVGSFALPATAYPPEITFTKTILDAKFRSEGAAVGDFNKDGKKDIVAGSVWYAAPDWKQHSLLEMPKTFDPRGYSDCFCNFAEDIDGDGWCDAIAVDFPGKQTWWFQNPGEKGGPWKRLVLTDITSNESPDFVDVDGDGKRELVHSAKEDMMAITARGADVFQPWKTTIIADAKDPKVGRFYHGLGIADLNGDGKRDVLIRDGYWQAGETAPWTFRPAKLGENCANMYSFDFDGDGDLDVLSSSAHAYGIWWHEQTPNGWVKHEIDRTFSQTHALWFGDLNGDGLPDFITGKRWWAHAPRPDGQGGDPGVNEPAVMFWFEMKKENGRPVWIPHQFDHDSGVGTQFEVTDVNGDGLLDVVTSNKKGTFYFQQARSNKE